jgi:dimeric dUTPase (all-alpha-NTP-PPase superfamily)
MKITDIELIKEMLVMQERLNDAIMKEYHLTEITTEQINMATLDEIGELNHELKANWCWWKKSQAPVDRKKVLEELVDIWHFVLIHVNVNLKGTRYFDHYTLDEINRILNTYRVLIESDGLSLALGNLLMSPKGRILQLIAISEYIGFNIQQIYEAYCDKNKVNYQRLKEGY